MCFASEDKCGFVPALMSEEESSWFLVELLFDLLLELLLLHESNELWRLGIPKVFTTPPALLLATCTAFWLV